jgi:hypothetical protein
MERANAFKIRDKPESGDWEFVIRIAFPGCTLDLPHKSIALSRGCSRFSFSVFQFFRPAVAFI